MGLGNRFSLAEGTGMLFIYEHPLSLVFWMKRMSFPIDIIWIQTGKIIHIDTMILPPAPETHDRDLKRYGKDLIVDMVLEVPGGYTRKKGIFPGDEIHLVR